MEAKSQEGHQGSHQDLPDKLRVGFYADKVVEEPQNEDQG